MSDTAKNRGKGSMPQRGRRMGKQMWVKAARDALVKGGLEAVKVERLAKSLKATRAAFYWHFDSRDDLLDALVAFWRERATKAYNEIRAENARNGVAELEAMNDLWVNDQDIDPEFEVAMRAWARVSKPVADVVRQVDQRRIEALKSMFNDLGYSDKECLVRARIAFMQQVGYYTMGIKESRKARQELAPIYLKVLLGR